MPDTPETPDAELQPESTPPAAPAPAAFVPVDEFKLYQQQMMQTLETISEGLRAIRSSSSAPATPVPPSAPLIDEDAYAKAIAEGDTRVIAAYTRQEKQRVKDENEALIRAHVEPLRNTGLASIGDLTAERASDKLKYFKRYEKEIRQKVEGLGPEQKLNPRVWEIAHNAVVGEHLEELMAAQKEEILRGGGGAGQTPGAGGTGRQKEDKNRVPDVKELLGQEAQDALDSRGLTPDEFSKRAGYKGGWAEYAGVIKKQREPVTNG